MNLTLLFLHLSPILTSLSHGIFDSAHRPQRMQTLRCLGFLLSRELRRLQLRFQSKLQLHLIGYTFYSYPKDVKNE